MGAWASVVLAAGKGTRMKSDIPKVMHRLLGRPLIGYVLRLLGDIGMHHNVVVTGHGGEMVREYVGSLGGASVVQEPQLGTAHAVLCARAALEGFRGSILILCGDTPLLHRETVVSFLEAHEASGRALSLLTAEISDPTGYGRILRGGAGGGEIEGVVEHRDASAEQRLIREVNTGIYAADPDFLFEVLQDVGSDNSQGEYYLTDIIGLAVVRGTKVGATCNATEEEAWGINSRQDLSVAEGYMLDRIRSYWMESGVTLESKETVYIEPEVVLSRDVVIGPHVVLKGRTRVGQGATIGALSYIEGVEVPAGAVVPPLSRLVFAAGAGLSRAGLTE
jgi:bifunctional UDP-N-acetylglucosamine pyrophosphorylase/glucosamine-1-phosphate N-acetyltransferase